MLVCSGNGGWRLLTPACECRCAQVCAGVRRCAGVCRCVQVGRAWGQELLRKGQRPREVEAGACAGNKSAGSSRVTGLSN